MSDRTQVMSFGGGKQSVAMCLLVAQGKLPRPDYIVIADTGREAQSTWDYLEQVVQPMLAEVDLRVEVAPHSLATVDLYAHNGDLLMPAFTTQSGKPGALPTFCSNEWKQRVIARWLKRQGVKQCDLWLGFTTDEIHRVKPSPVKWARRTFPLIDLGMSRDDCIALTDDAGLPEPQKSACWCCPLRHNSEWRQMKETHPQDFHKAVALEKSLRARDPHVYLHRSAVPLDQVDFGKDDSERNLQCSLGFCFV